MLSCNESMYEISRFKWSTERNVMRSYNVNERIKSTDFKGQLTGIPCYHAIKI